MARLSTTFLLVLLLSSACSKRSSSDPCAGMMCCFQYTSILVQLVDAKTGKDLLYGSQPKIPYDSIRILAGDSAYKLPSWTDSANSAVRLNVMYPNITLRVSLPGKVSIMKLTTTVVNTSCCTSAATSMRVGENPVEVKPDKYGSFVIPFSTSASGKD
ncbi:MAG TPA: hypothetical protein VM802_11055 [Chitinophaga sp.]|uniref:hypothetical protein n=1 Tax=Chitinophaga sp. TaxID=1869181 RepID=UPI002BF3C339|nr:hypothetical protein [Chitinophaga sp.]HVI45404.1 hypothetical protein [Chitinophaga sp.]